MPVTKHAPDSVRKLISQLERAGVNPAQYPFETNSEYVARLKTLAKGKKLR